MAHLYTEGLSVGYEGVPLIRDISLRVEKGEILTLIGPNGAGKTTILKSLIRQLAPLGGAVRLDGREICSISGKELSMKLSVVLTDRVRTELMTCKEVVATGRYPYTGRFGILSEKDRRIVREAMELVHIEELSGRDFMQISDGQKQRVMLARAICQEPELIVLDEPTSFLDMKYKLEFLSILQNMSRTRRLSVILSLHELDLAGRISDKIACVRGDRIDRFGTPEEIFSDGYMQELSGMTVGSYDERTGDLELEPVKGDPQVFVIGGGGAGIFVYRRLWRQGIPFAAGVLHEHDVEYPVAAALASLVISQEAFEPVSRKAYEQAAKVLAGCSRVICCVETFGTMNARNRELAELGKEKMILEYSCQEPCVDLSDLLH